MQQIFEKLKKKENLTFEESKSAFEILMTGKASEDQIYNFLTLLSEKGEISDEMGKKLEKSIKDYSKGFSA